MFSPSRSLPFLAAAALVCLTATAPAENDLIVNGNFSAGLLPWHLDRLEGAQGEAHVEAIEGGGSAVRVEVQEAAAAPFHVQLFQGRLPVRGGETYHLTFRARGVPGTTVGLNLMVAEDPWTNLWKADLELTPEWQDFSFEIRPSQSSDNARVTFTRLAGSPGEFWFTNISLKH